MNTAHGAFKLSIRRIVCDTFLIPWRHKRAFITPLMLPASLMVAIIVGWQLASGTMPALIGWLIFGLYGFAFAILAVACHRLILLGPSPETLAVRLKVGRREIRFFVWLGIIVTGYSLLNLMLVLVILNILNLVSLDAFRGDRLPWIDQRVITPSQYVAMVLGTYVLSRCSLILPAIALDHQVNLKWAWRQSRYNGWRLAATVGVFPALLSTAVDLLVRSKPTIVEVLLLAAFSVVASTLGIIALSLSYQDLEEGLAGREQTS